MGSNLDTGWMLVMIVISYSIKKDYKDSQMGHTKRKIKKRDCIG
jgi:hypothetical protein